MSSLLVLGGARSGKSAYAEARALKLAPKRKIYIATSEVYDEEMRARVQRHQTSRGSDWQTVEAPLALGAALLAHDAEGSFILIECLTLWVSNMMLAGLEVAPQVAALGAQLKNLKSDVALVSAEVGLGIVPDNHLARAYRDALGLANQELALLVDEVVLVVAGLPLVLKSAAGPG